MESFIKLIKKNALLLWVILGIISCSKNEDNTLPTQTIITSDSSNTTGRLYVEFYDVNGNQMNNGIANLYLSYSDLKNNLPLYTLTSNNNGRVDFGFVLNGNYYLTGTNLTGNLRDTGVAQVLPQRTITRKLILR